MSSRASAIRAPGRWLTILAAIAIAFQASSILPPPSPARAAGIDPRDVAITDDEAGKQAARTVDKEGIDDRSVWVELRWERDQESPDAETGPATVANTVWVAKDIASARAIFAEQAAKNKEFPEAFFEAAGPHPLPINKVGDETEALSACLDCNAKDDIFLHHRATFRRGIVVSTVYLYGADGTTPHDLMNWYTAQAAGRIPDAAVQAPERIGEPAVANQPTAESQPASSGDSQPAANSQAAAPPSDGVHIVQANPKDLAIKIDEAGKRAEVEHEQDGSDARGSWYEVRYERPGTGGRFYEGPVTVYSYVHIAKDVEAARQVFREKAGQNEEMPEADRRVGDRFELNEANEVGDEGQGLSACERSCNARDEIYLHKRLVTRSTNVVSVVYLYGLSHEEGLTDWHARYFGGLVMQRARGE